MGRSKDWSNCARCGKKTHGNYIVEEGFVCYNCSRKGFHRIGVHDRKPYISIDKALSKVYEVKGYKAKNGRIQISHICPPQTLIGRKVKLVLVEDA